MTERRTALFKGLSCYGGRWVGWSVTTERVMGWTAYTAPTEAVSVDGMAVGAIVGALANP